MTRDNCWIWMTLLLVVDAIRLTLAVFIIDKLRRLRTTYDDGSLPGTVLKRGEFKLASSRRHGATN